MELELVKQLDPPRPNQLVELYRWGDEYLYVSTVGDVAGPDLSPGSLGIVSLGGIMGGYATSGEETMAFRCDAEGEVQDWAEIAVSSGVDSRDEVLDELRSRSPTPR